jgi:hypothetical protein
MSPTQTNEETKQSGKKGLGRGRRVLICAGIGLFLFAIGTEIREAMGGAENDGRSGYGRSPEGIGGDASGIETHHVQQRLEFPGASEPKTSTQLKGLLGKPTGAQNPLPKDG